VAIRQNEGLVGTIGIALRLCQIAPRDLRDRHLPALLSGQVSACTALTEPGTGSDFLPSQQRRGKTAMAGV